MAEMIWRIGVDPQEARKAGSEFGKASDKSTKKKGGGGGAFAGGFLGGLFGSLLSSMRSLFEPLQAIATLLVTALYPILKPFLILFIKVGLLLYKFLNKILGTDSDVKGVIGENKDGEVEVGSLGKKIALWIGVFLGILAGLAAAIFGAPALIVIAIGLAVAIFGKKIAEFFISLGYYIAMGLHGIWILLSRLGIWIWEGLVRAFNAVWEFLARFGAWLWEGLVSSFTAVWEVLKGIGQWIWDGLVGAFTSAWELLKGIGTWIWDGLVNTFTSAFQALKGIGQWIWNEITSLFNKKKNSESGTTKTGNDFILTPRGDMIRSSPSDYLFATKNPNSLMGGGRGSNINVSINGGLITEQVARDIGKIILREVKSGGSF